VRRTLSTVTSRPATGPTPASPAAARTRVGNADGLSAREPGHPESAAAESQAADGRAADGRAADAQISDARAADAQAADAHAEVGVPLAGDNPKDRHRLPPAVITYWRWRIFFSALPAMVLLAGIAWALPWGSPALRWAVVGLFAVLLVLGIVLVPPIRFGVFWYAISPTEIDVQHGVVFVKRTVLPMHRVQNLRTERGPMSNHYNMSNLQIRTAGGAVTISGLDRDEADDVCDQITRMAELADDV